MSLGFHAASDVFKLLFYELVDCYEYRFNRNPDFIIPAYNDILPSSITLPIYGSVNLPNYIMYLLQLPLLERLTELRQLAHTYILFPGANHTRFEHSIGVMHRASKIFKKVKNIVDHNENCKKEGAYLNNNDQKILEIAALLHDIGHPGLGHAVDGVTGYMVELLKNSKICYLRPKKLDTVIAFYLISENEQLSKALDIIATIEIDDEILRQLFKDIIAQIIMEEEIPLFDDPTPNHKYLRKVHLLTTILGTYRGIGGIDVDRLDWMIRDSYHANIKEKLPPDIKEKYEKFLKENISEKFDIAIDENCEYTSIASENFNNLMRELREHIYKEIYEGIQRAFIDALLTRLVYSTIRIIYEIGHQIASLSTVIRAIMGYLLLPDHLLREYTQRILNATNLYNIEHLIGSKIPDLQFAVRSANLLQLLNYIHYIMHTLNNPRSTHVFHSPLFGLHYKLIDLNILDLSIITISSETFAELIKRSLKKFYKEKDDIRPLASIFQNFIVAARANPIKSLKTTLLEAYLLQIFQNQIYIMVNYYIFRKLDDVFREKIRNTNDLINYMKTKLKDEIIYFILTPKTLRNKIFDETCKFITENIIFTAINPLKEKIET